MNFQGVCFLTNLSTLIAINLSSNHFWIFERCVIFQSFVNFQIVCCSPNRSTFNVNNLSSHHFRIFERCVTFQLYVNFQIVCCLPNISKFIVIDLSWNHLCVFRQYFHNHCTWLIQLICHLIIRELSNYALFVKSFHIHSN